MATIEIERAIIPEPARDEGVEVDGFAPADAAENARARLVIASYTIRYGAGPFLITGGIGRRLGLTRRANRPRVINSHLEKAALALSDNRRLPSPDIVALQETDRLTARAGRCDVARQLAGGLRMTYARAAAGRPRADEAAARKWYRDFEEHIPADDAGDTGVAILSRLPLKSAARIDLPWRDCEWRPRLGLSAVIRNGPRDIHVFNSHIDPHAAVEEQLGQHRAVLARAEKLSGAVVLLGDFNTLARRARREMRSLMEAHGFVTPMRTGTATWRAGLIRLHTDWIFVRGARVSRWGVARVGGVSDHWPVWAEIELQDETAV
jgi:endonuclease/exonuclease/phosphatase family metal-dependent hydrolase